MALGLTGTRPVTDRVVVAVLEKVTEVVANGCDTAVWPAAASDESVISDDPETMFLREFLVNG